MKILKIIKFVVIGLVLLIVLVIGYYLILEKKDQNEEDKVDVTVSYDSERCKTEDYPLVVKITNNSSRAILNTEARVGIYREGYSNDISDYNSRFKTDRIIKPNEFYSFCMRIRLEEDLHSFIYSPADLIYKINYSSIRFEK